MLPSNVTIAYKELEKHQTRVIEDILPWWVLIVVRQETTDMSCFDLVDIGLEPLQQQKSSVLVEISQIGGHQA
ncbi:hypothetical protein RRG08_056097 [Elysia crispata]|uniref:Uncharacterized protein n=1 Tax=Elysia crispata TaxID=231223 RepID=A0AAE1DEG0_9GAST|nr:hypothetical protein RRG08_056097 [Elysia crispata]